MSAINEKYFLKYTLLFGISSINSNFVLVEMQGIAKSMTQ